MGGIHKRSLWVFLQNKANLQAQSVSDGTEYEKYETNPNAGEASLLHGKNTKRTQSQQSLNIRYNISSI